MTDSLLLLFIVVIIILLLTVVKKANDLFNKINGQASDFKKDQERIEKNIKDEMVVNRNESANIGKGIREEVSSSFKLFGDSVDRRMSDFSNSQNKHFEFFSKSLVEVAEKNEKKMEKIREIVENRLDCIQKDNSEKLEKMRATVDEKLHETLEKRLGESFKIVSERLELVHKGLGEMQTLAANVGDFKKVFQNIKTRGISGEVQLGNLLEQILIPDQFDKNISTKKGSADRVEFAIKMPGNDKINKIWLPIDAKFPLEDYQKLVSAHEKGDTALIAELNKALEVRIKAEAKDIKNKYIDPPYTTDFGILFLPMEGLYAEITQRPGLCESLHRQYKVMVAGPNTLYYFLNVLQIGFRTLAIEKRSSEVWELLGVVKTQFGKFGEILEKTHKKLQEATHTIEDAKTKTHTIERKLRNVQGIPMLDEDKAKKLLVSSDMILSENDTKKDEPPKLE